LIKKAVKKPGLYWFVAPSYRQAKAIGWTKLKFYLEADPDWKFNEMELKAYHPHLHTTIELKGADNQDSLRGIGLDGVVLDECATMKPNVFPSIIRPMLADTRGWALFIGTPKGKNWFYDAFVNENPEWKSWHYSTKVNHYIPAEELEAAKKDMPSRLFHQEFLAEFLDDEERVFRRLRLCTVGEYQDPVKGERYYIGCDLAKHQDWTVLTVIDITSRHVVCKERFQRISWPEQKERIQRLSERYNYAPVLIDSTGVGDAIEAMLSEIGSLFDTGDP